MRIAVTGGVAEGKSTVLGFVRDQGLTTASSDEVARAVFVRDDVQRCLAELLGVLAPVAPAQLRHAIAVSPDLRRDVNRLMHPQIRAAMEESSAMVHEVPLLIEACLYGCYDVVWVVSCGHEEQRRRLALRLGSEEAAEAFLQTQLPTRAKLAFADLVIRSDRPLRAMREAVAEGLARTLRN